MFERNVAFVLSKRLKEPRRFIQVVSGPRQTGKTTAIKQAVKAASVPFRVSSADEAASRGTEWIETEWNLARSLARSGSPAVLVLDEIQKVEQWSTVVKRLWDEDSWDDIPLHVVVSGSSSLLIQKGLSESLMGRFELLRSTHWSYSEMSEAFGYSFDDYLRFGGYPGSAFLKDDPERWRMYMRDSIIEASLSKDVLQLEDVRKPALLKRLFELGAQYSSQEISFRSLLGQLDDRGNTATMAHYLDLLTSAGLLTGLQKYEDKPIKSRKSSPRLMLFDPSLMTASWEGPNDLLADSASRGHLVETAVGATLLARAAQERFDLMWWRDGDLEVDFVVRKGAAVSAIEVKSGKVGRTDGLAAFCSRHPKARPLVVGDRNLSVEAFLRDAPDLF